MGSEQSGKRTLSEFVNHVWAPRARRRLAPKTWERDAVVYGKHIKPYLGGRPIASLDIEDLVEWQDRLEGAGVGAATTIKAIGILSSVISRGRETAAVYGRAGQPCRLARSSAGRAPSPASRLGPRRG